MRVETEHKGFVKQIAGNRLTISLITGDLCQDCKISGHCANSARRDVEIEVFTNFPQGYTIGSEVIVIGRKSSYYLAVVLCYVCPLFILLSTLGLLHLFSHLSQTISAVLSLIMLGLYFFILYGQRHKLSNKVKFTLQENYS